MTKTLDRGTNSGYGQFVKIYSGSQVFFSLIPGESDGMLGHLSDERRRKEITSLIKDSHSEGTIAVSSWVDLEKEFGEEVYSEALYQLTRLELAPPQAKVCWNDILLHQCDLAGRLGRPVGLLTALCDYFQYVKPLLNEPILVEVRLLLQKEEGAYKDELTGLFNRRYFNMELPREMERYRRFGHPFSLLMIDVDHFKLFNDGHGHLAGDQALRTLAGIINQTARLCDRAARFGGEEFTVILPQSCREEALIAAERIRAEVARSPVVFDGANLGPITVSIGVATYPADALDGDQLLRRADEALYLAKRQRNQVAAFRDPKRQHPRYPLDSQLNLSLAGGYGGNLLCRAKNISFGGMLCETDSGPPSNSNVEVTLSGRDKSQHLALHAQVRRVNKIEGNRYFLGLSFELPTAEERNRLMEFIQGLSKATH
jgi:diguanylate cyclase (GGDEF)-like protein